MKDVKNILTFDVTKTPGKKMMENLMAAMQTKLHQLFLDPTLNSIRTVEINLQDSFVYFARRFDAFVSELPPRKQIRIYTFQSRCSRQHWRGEGTNPALLCTPGDPERKVSRLKIPSMIPGVSH